MNAATDVPSRLVQLDAADASKVGAQPLVFGHSLASHPLLAEEAIADLLDSFPHEKLFVLTMGDDPTRSQDNERLEHRGVSGTDLIEAVRRGRLWCNITNVDAVDPRYRELTALLYAELAEQLPEYRDIESHCTILVSSPNAMVYYHVDGPPSFLWHVAGRKRLWTYPALDRELLSTELLEEIFAGVRQEYVPYRAEFDERATTFDLVPGQVASWPQNAPHRITNLDSLNISFVTDHYTAAARRRARVYNANRFLHRAHVPRTWLSTSDDGVVSAAKVALHRVGQRLRPEDTNRKAHRPATRQVDPAAPGAIRPL